MEIPLERSLLHNAMLWYGVSMLPRLRRLDFAEILQLLVEADEHSARQPLYLRPEPQFVVPSWSDDPMTGGQVLALMIFGLWVLYGEDEDKTGSLLHDWPIILDAVVLTDLLAAHATPENGGAP